MMLAKSAANWRLYCFNSKLFFLSDILWGYMGTRLAHFQFSVEFHTEQNLNYVKKKKKWIFFMY